MELIFIGICFILLVIANFISIAFNIGKSHGYQQARNEDAALLLSESKVRNVASMEDMSKHIANTLLSEDSLNKKTIYIVRPSDAHAVQKLFKERDKRNQNTNRGDD
jgi:hypothetical protein